MTKQDKTKRRALCMIVGDEDEAIITQTMKKKGLVSKSSAIRVILREYKELSKGGDK